MAMPDAPPYLNLVIDLLGRYGPRDGEPPPSRILERLLSLVSEVFGRGEIDNARVRKRIEEIVIAFGAGYLRRIEDGGEVWDRVWPAAEAWIRQKVKETVCKTERYLRKVCGLGRDLPSAQRQTIDDLTRRFIEGGCDCHLWDAGKILTKKARCQRGQRCLAEHRLLGWDAAGRIGLEAFIRRAVKGDLPKGSEARGGRHFAAGALQQGMFWPWLHNAAHVLWVKVLHHLCVKHSARLQPGQLCPRCDKAVRSRGSEAKVKPSSLNRRSACALFEDGVLRQWFCLRHSVRSLLDRPCPECDREVSEAATAAGPGEPPLIVARLLFILDPMDGGSLREERWYCCQRCATYYPEEVRRCPNCLYQRGAGASRSRVYVPARGTIPPAHEQALSSSEGNTESARMAARLDQEGASYANLFEPVCRVFKVDPDELREGIAKLRKSKNRQTSAQGELLGRVLGRNASQGLRMEALYGDPREALDRLLEALVELERLLKGQS